MHRFKAFLKYSGALAAVLTIWGVALHLILTAAGTPILGSADFSTVLFGASSIALFLVSLVIGLLAIFGWQSLQKAIQESVVAATQRQTKRLENELRGRVWSVLGLILGDSVEQSGDQTPAEEERKRDDRLREALYYCQQGYERLKEVGGGAEYMALNNLIHFSCLLGERNRRGFILKAAKEMRDKAEEHNAQPNLQLTYCNAVFEFEGQEADLDDAVDILEVLRRKMELTGKDKREAERLASRYSNLIQRSRERRKLTA